MDISKPEYWWWRAYKEYGSYVSDRLYDLLCFATYHKKTTIPSKTILSTLDRAYTENWGDKDGNIWEF